MAMRGSIRIRTWAAIAWALSAALLATCSIDTPTFTQGTEDCAAAGDEDGNGLSDGADPACAGAAACRAACGNGRLDPGEGCDDGNAASGDGCDANCTVTACGNGVLTAGEGCDDGNTASGDGCDASCTSSGRVASVATFGFTATVQSFLVPPGVTSVKIDASGAQGADAVNGFTRAPAVAARG
jgi:cysteine-rich repeat protein